MKFEHNVQEETQTIQKRETFYGEAGGYEIYFNWNDDEGAELTLYGERSKGHVGLMHLRPKHLTELERFAENLPKILPEVIAAIRDAGFADLRSKWDKSRDEMDLMMEQMRVEQMERLQREAGSIIWPPQ